MKTLASLAKMRLSQLPWRFALSSTALVSALLPLRREHLPFASLDPKSSVASARFLSGKTEVNDGETLETLAEKLTNREFRNVVVLIGAGVSASAGIPDFRTPGTGLYDRLQHFQLPYPEAIFDVDYYQNHPKPFVELCQEIWPGKEGTIGRKNIF
jgi:hypothetical protein